MSSRCTICNHHYTTIPYKGGFICEDCLNAVKSYGLSDSRFDV